MEMDVTYIRALAERDKEDEADKPAPVQSIYAGEEISTRPLTPQLFDALFGSNDNRSRR